MSNSIQKTTIQLEDGRIVERTKIVFLPKPDWKNPNIVYTSDSAYKVEGGTFRRLIPKVKRKKRK